MEVSVKCWYENVWENGNLEGFIISEDVNTLRIMALTLAVHDFWTLSPMTLCLNVCFFISLLLC